MENEQMTQQRPTYDQIAQAYGALLTENQQLKMELNAVRNNDALLKIKTLVEVIDKFSNSEDKETLAIVKNAKWHLKEILAKPKEK